MTSFLFSFYAPSRLHLITPLSLSMSSFVINHTFKNIVVLVVLLMKRCLGWISFDGYDTFVFMNSSHSLIMCFLWMFPRCIFFPKTKLLPLVIKFYRWESYTQIHARMQSFILCWCSLSQDRERVIIVGWRLVVVFQLHQIRPWGHCIGSLEWLQFHSMSLALTLQDVLLGWRRPIYIAISVEFKEFFR